MNDASIVQKGKISNAEMKESAKPGEKPAGVSRMKAALKRFACATVLGASMLAGCEDSERSVFDWTTKEEMPEKRAQDKIASVCDSKKAAVIAVKRIYMDGGDLWLLPGKDTGGYNLSEGESNPGYLVLKEGAEARIEGIGTIMIESIGDTALDVRIMLTTVGGKVYHFSPNYEGAPVQGIGKTQDGIAVPENEMPHNDSVYRHLDALWIYGVGKTAWGFDLDETLYGIADGAVLEGDKEGCAFFNMQWGASELLRPVVLFEPGSKDRCLKACMQNDCVPGISGEYGSEAWGETCD